MIHSDLMRTIPEQSEIEYMPANWRTSQYDTRYEWRDISKFRWQLGLHISQQRHVLLKYQSTIQINFFF